MSDPADEFAIHELAQRVRQRRARLDANLRAVESGSADERVMRALGPAFEAVGCEPADQRDGLHKEVIRFVTDRFDQALENGDKFDPDSEATAAVEHVHESAKTYREGLKSLTRWANPVGTDVVRSELQLARDEGTLSRALVSLPRPTEALERQNDHIINVLERLNNQFAAQGKWIVIGAIAATAAAIAGIVTIIFTA